MRCPPFRLPRSDDRGIHLPPQGGKIRHGEPKGSGGRSLGAPPTVGGRRGRCGVVKIALISPLYEAVPPKLYGGTERIVAYLADALVELGHDVTLFASGDAHTKA